MKKLMIKQELSDGYICLPTDDDCPYLQIQYSKELNTTSILFKSKRDYLIDKTFKKDIKNNMFHEIELPQECQKLIESLT